MALEMEDKTFFGFYKSTALGYSKSLQRHICKQLEVENRITFDNQRSMDDTGTTCFFESKDSRSIISKTAMDLNYADFYEKWEFIKLYKYSVPFFYETNNRTLKDILEENKIQRFDPDNFRPTFTLYTSIKEAQACYYETDDALFIKFVLQKSYTDTETFEQVDYRFPIVIYIKKQCDFLEIRYDSVRYDMQFGYEAYEKLVNDCIVWMTQSLDIQLFQCNHADIVAISSDKQNQTVRIYKQMMDLNTGGAAELTAAEGNDYVLPFIGEIRELIDENEELFNQVDEVKSLLLQYLADKEATASYPYIYLKWVKPVESQSYLVRLTFEYFNHKFTLLQHLTGSCKDYGMERMNNAIKYLCESGSFVKGETIKY